MLLINVDQFWVLSIVCEGTLRKLITKLALQKRFGIDEHRFHAQDLPFALHWKVSRRALTQKKKRLIEFLPLKSTYVHESLRRGDFKIFKWIISAWVNFRFRRCEAEWIWSWRCEVGACEVEKMWSWVNVGLRTCIVNVRLRKWCNLVNVSLRRCEVEWPCWANVRFSECEVAKMWGIV
jgi:hypothetical protein